MSGYTPRDPAAIAAAALVALATLLAGFAFRGRSPSRWARVLAWLLAAASTFGVERITANEPAGLRMIAIIVTLLYAMKAVATLEANAEKVIVLTAWQWLGFAALWPGMRPAIFAKAGGPPQPGGLRLAAWGCFLGAAGCLLIAAAGFLWDQHDGRISDKMAHFLATVLLLPGLSLALHFGVFNILAGVWRLAGVDARRLFRAPLAASSLDEFWSRRWNLAFSEMTAVAIYRPASELTGRKAAMALAFAASGLLHEIAISIPVLAGFGLPMLYFLLHGSLVLLERRLQALGVPVSGWGWLRHAWVLFWLAAPLPILFHGPFLRGVVWPLIGMS